jgi:tetratricopeptide (TPR) repeat protein
MVSIESLDEERVWLDKGNKFYSSGNFENAEIAFKKTLSINPQNMDAWFFQAKSLILLLNFDEGIKSFENALKIDPSNKDVKKYKDLASEKRGYFRQFGDTIDHMASNGGTKKLLPITYQDRDKLLFKNIYGSLKNFTYQGNLSKTKQKNIINWDFCEVLRSDFRRYESQSSLNDDKMDIRTAKEFFDNGFLYAFLGYYQEAIKAIDDGLRIFSKDENAWNNKGVALGQIGQIAEAELIFNTIISQHPQKISSMLNLCWILNQSEKYDEIQRLCETVIKIDPNNSTAKDIKQITTINASIKNKMWWQFWK